jgi:hypothetical protein
MMLYDIGFVFNLFDGLGLMSCKCNSASRQVLVGFQSTEAFRTFGTHTPIQRCQITRPAM